MSSLKPFQNESDALQIAGLNIENRQDRVAMFGSLDITRDKTGLLHAKALQAVVNAAVEALQAAAHLNDLPDSITLAPTDTVKNPFG